MASPQQRLIPIVIGISLRPFRRRVPHPHAPQSDPLAINCAQITMGGEDYFLSCWPVTLPLWLRVLTPKQGGLGPSIPDFME